MLQTTRTLRLLQSANEDYACPRVLRGMYCRGMCSLHLKRPHKALTLFLTSQKKAALKNVVSYPQSLVSVIDVKVRKASSVLNLTFRKQFMYIFSIVLHDIRTLNIDRFLDFASPSR